MFAQEGYLAAYQAEWLADQFAVAAAEIPALQPVLAVRCCRIEPMEALQLGDKLTPSYPRRLWPHRFRLVFAAVAV